MEKVAVETAKNLASGALTVDRTKKGLFNTVLNFALQFNFVKDQVFGKAKQQVMKLSGGLYPAPLRVNILINQKIYLIICFFLNCHDTSAYFLITYFLDLHFRF